MKRIFVDAKRVTVYRKKRRNAYLFSGFLSVLYVGLLGISLGFASLKNRTVLWLSMALFSTVVLALVLYSITMIGKPLSGLIRRYSDALAYPPVKVKGTVLSVRTVIERNVELDEITLSGEGEMPILFVESGEFPADVVGKTGVFEVYDRLILSFSEENGDE